MKKDSKSMSVKEKVLFVADYVKVVNRGTYTKVIKLSQKEMNKIN